MSAMNSSSVFAGNEGCTRSTFGTLPILVIGAKSLTGSNPTDLYNAGLIAWALLTVISTV